MAKCQRTNFQTTSKVNRALKKIRRNLSVAYSHIPLFGRLSPRYKARFEAQVEYHKKEMMEKKAERHEELSSRTSLGQLVSGIEVQTDIPHEESALHINPESLEEIRERGRRGLLLLMQNSGIPLQTQGGAYREAEFPTEFVRFQLERSGMMSDEVLENIFEKLVSENEDVRKNASYILGNIAIDRELFDDEIRRKALAGLIRASNESKESVDVLLQFGFTRNVIAKASEFLNSSPNNERKQKGIRRKSTYLLAAGALGAVTGAALGFDLESMSLLTSIAGFGLGLYTKKRSRVELRRLESDTRTISEQAFREVEEFQQLLSQSEARAQLPAHEEE
jgi:hypothetical protein